MRFFIILFLLSFVSAAFARPQYAVRKKIISCSACHFNPAGGGARNIFGKAVGSRTFPMGLNSKQDYFSFDFRAININTTEEREKNPNGSGIMTSNVSAAIPVNVLDNGSTTYAVAAYDLGGFGPGARETYARFSPANSDDSLPMYVVVGKFNIPFGLLTDEHRTYTRKQTNTDYNKFEMGFMLSGTPHHSFHYDIALVEGYQKAAAYPSAGDNRGYVFNLRYNFNQSPVILGLSGLYNEGQVDSNGKTRNGNPMAAAVYTAVSLDHITNKRIEGSWLLEISMAKNYNRSEYNSSMSYFINPTQSSTYYNEILDKKSIGMMTRFDIDLSKSWASFYKLDIFAPDKEYFKDHFLIHSVGFKYWYSANVDIDLRYEKAKIGRDGIAETGVSAAKDKILIIGRMWL